MKSQEEILRRIKARRASDMFGWEWCEYLRALPIEVAKPYLNDDVTEWDADLATDEAVVACMKDYMPFAWGKASNCRGLSASRSISHYVAWLWLAGADDLAGVIEDYAYYGKPQLRAICERYGWNWREWDDGEWRNGESETSVSPDDVQWSPLATGGQA